MLALCINRGGYRKGRRVAQFIFEWELVVRANAGATTVDEFASWWRVGLATAYRRLAEFRELFPQLGPHGTPNDLMHPLLAVLLDAGATEDELDATALEVPA